MTVTIDNRLLRKLERFRIFPRGLYRGGQAGMRRSLSRGTGLEFADHKAYSVGDDIRYLDWMLYGRLEELFVKVFEQEESLPVYILLDCSASMSLGEPTKAEFAKRIAAAICYVGLANQDHVRVSLFGNGLISSSRTLSGKAQIYEMLDFLGSAPSSGTPGTIGARGKETTDVTRAIEGFLSEHPLSGSAFILSDFLDPKGVMEGVRLLASRRFGIYGMHVVAPEEAAPELSGDVELFDVETARVRKVPLKRDTVVRYREFLADYWSTLRAELQRYGVWYLQLFSDRPVEETLFTVFPKEGVFE